ncbi:flippase [Musicola keenii]|uniref:flippase n=1 Tax=Musicola keenii TaxID=2884250 RepID=UPI001781A930|nr:flippase [Musicola keenii]
MRINNILWSLVGLLFPIAIAFLTIPYIVEKIGMERFGLLSLAWGLIGYAGVFDLGIGRATTQLVARLLGEGEHVKAYYALKVSEKLSMKVGFFGSLLLCTIIFLGGFSFINYSPSLKHEVLISSFLIAITVPFQCISTMYRGYCEALERFMEVNAVKTGLGLINFLGPYFVSIYTNNIIFMILSLFLSRLFGAGLYKIFSEFFSRKKSDSIFLLEKKASDTSTFQKEIRHELLRFGGWYTISSIVSPFLVQIDRFFIGGIISAAAVGIYTLPYEIVTKMIMFVGAVSAVALPRYSKVIKIKPEVALREFNLWLWVVIIFVGAGCGFLFMILPEFLQFWLKGSVESDSIHVGRILCVGIFINSIGIMFYTLIHALGDSKSTALIHLVELPFYIFLLYFFIVKFGIAGAAIAWTLRVGVDTFFMYLIMIRKRRFLTQLGIS